ncbi:transposase [Methylococcus capsulatus]|uniref:Transposase n=1 Tax=Methylococcus capsulatus TaxID=414 RepID=A0AA35US38_METCP|nr:transposase [Methylococcus capsulatus]
MERLRRFRVTTDSKHDLPERNLTPTGPNQVRSSDITYLWTDGCRPYPAITPDPFNREVVGWSPKPRMTADIVTDAPTMAWFRRKPAAIDPSFGSGSPVYQQGDGVLPRQAVVLDFGLRIARAVHAGRARGPDSGETGDRNPTAWKAKNRGKVESVR